MTPQQIAEMLLIVPYGIETGLQFMPMVFPIQLLIVPYGIETSFRGTRYQGKGRF